jgi:hypothetical protein
MAAMQHEVSCLQAGDVMDNPVYGDIAATPRLEKQKGA